MQNISPWTSRNYLPHFNTTTRSQFITYRLADSLPKKVLDRVERQVELLPHDFRNRKRVELLEKYADQGLGSCALRHRNAAHIVIGNLKHFEGSRYTLREWVIMPNHVHVLLKVYEPWTLDRVTHSWKSYTATKINKRCNAPLYPFWQREVWDRYVRDDHHAKRIIHYIRMNPVKAGLCKRPEEWPYGSAGCQPASP